MKKRYMLTLSQKNMEELQALFREIGLNPDSGILSHIVDEFIAGTVRHLGPEIRAAQETGKKYSIAEFFVRVSGILQRIQRVIVALCLISL